MAGKSNPSKTVATQAPAGSRTVAVDLLVVGPAGVPVDDLLTGLRSKGCRIQTLPEADLAVHLAACPRPDAVIITRPRPDGLPSPHVLVSLQRKHLPVLVLGGDLVKLREHLA